MLYIYTVEYNQSGTPAELSEDSGSHHGFFIGDGDDLSMSEETPSSLSVYLELTQSTYEALTDPLVLYDTEECTPLLEKWCQKLCLVLSQYTGRQHAAADSPPALRQVSTVCPWRMSENQMRQSRYLATLCVLSEKCECIQDYWLTAAGHAADEDTRQQRYLLPWCYNSNTEELTASSEEFVETDSGLHSNHSSPLPLLTKYRPDASPERLEANLDGPEANSDTEMTVELSHPDRCTDQSDSRSGIPVTLQSTCRFMSAFWFLIDGDELCTYIEQLSYTDTDKQKALWSTLINCLIG